MKKLRNVRQEAGIGGFCGSHILNSIGCECAGAAPTSTTSEGLFLGKSLFRWGHAVAGIVVMGLLITYGLLSAPLLVADRRLQTILDRIRRMEHHAKHRHIHTRCCSVYVSHRIPRCPPPG
jgi:hypothetical protein